MNLFVNLCDFSLKFIVVCGTLYCLCFLVITLVERSLWGEIRDLVSHLHPLGKGSKGKGGQAIPIQIPYSMALFVLNFQLVRISHTNPSEGND